MRICVISDAHIKFVPWDAADRENAKLFQAFLKKAVGKYDLLVLNGDIFDLWFDWKSLIIKEYFGVLHRFAELDETGCKIVMISGNHDFWFNDFFTKHLNAVVQDKSHALTADGKKMFFSLRRFLHLQRYALQNPAPAHPPSLQQGAFFPAASRTCPAPGRQAFALQQVQAGSRPFAKKKK